MPDVNDWDKPNGRCRACGSRLNPYLMPMSEYPSGRYAQPTLRQMEETARAYWDAELAKIKRQVKMDADA